MIRFFNYIIDRSRITLSFSVLLMVASLYAYKKIPLEASPDIAIPYVSTTIVLEGISPEDGVRLLIKPCEVELRSVDGVKEITARALENYVNVVTEFETDVDINNALAEVRAAIDRARDKFPDEAKEPIVREVSINDFSTFVVSLVGKNADERVLYKHALALRRLIQQVPNVLEAEIRGNRQEVLEALVDRNKLEQYGISSGELVSAVSRNNLLVPAGKVDTGLGRFSIKLPGLIESYQDLVTLPLRANSDSVIQLGDVAEIRRTFKDSEGITLINGKQAISIEVQKRVGSNTIQVVDDIKKVLNEYKEQVPDGIELLATFDETPFLRQMVTELQGNILAAFFLVLMVIVASLGFRSAVLTSLGIPFAALGSLTLIYLMGMSFNFMVLFGFLLAIGMIVDGAIIVAEHADTLMADGLSPRDAYVTSSSRMFAPAMASTLTTMAAFLPMVFWPGVQGQFMRILPLTVFAVLTCSILYALIVLPILGSRYARAEMDEETRKALQTLEHDDPRQLSGVTGFYARFVEMTLKRPLHSLAGAMLILLVIFMAFRFLNAGTVYFTQSEHNFGEINVRARGNLSAQEAIDLVKEVETIVRNTPNVKSVYTSAYPVGTAQGRRGATEDEIGHMLVQLVGQHERTKTSDEVFWDIRQSTEHLYGIHVLAQQMQDGPPKTRDIHIELTSDNQELLQMEAKRIREHLQHDVSDLVDIDDTLPLPGIEWELLVDRTQAAKYGASVIDAGLAVQLLTDGVLVGKYRPDDVDDEIDMRVRFPMQERTIEALDYLTVNTPSGAVPISNFVTRNAVPRVNKLQRMDGSGVASIYANVAYGVLPNLKLEEVKQWVEHDAHLNPAVHVKFRGSDESQRDAKEFLGIAFVLALLLMATLLVVQFNDFYQTVLVLSSILMSTTGVLLGHMIFQQPFSIVLGGMGIVALAGVIVNNNIILLDTYNKQRLQYPDMHYLDLAVRTGAQRFRPVFLTALTTGLGLIPLATGISVDVLGREISTRGTVASYWKPLASSLIYGLSFGTLLTLIITPLLMILPEYLREKLEARRAAKSRN